MTPLKVGDRVRIYLSFDETPIATVKRVNGDRLDVLFDGDELLTTGYHRKQCRRLRKRKRREWFIWNNQAYEIHNDRSRLEDVYDPTNKKWDEAIRVREVVRPVRK